MPDSLAELERLPAEIAAGFADALALTEQDLALTARADSSGPVTAAALRRLGPAYSVRLGARLNPAIINVRTGRFRESWNTARDEDSVSLWNDAPEAVFLQNGTRRMVPRPIDDLILAEVGPRFDQRVERVLDRLFG